MKKKCNRKVWVLLDPLAHVLDGIKVTPTDLLNTLHVRELSALDAMVHGHGDLQCWSDLVAVMNVCEHMALNGVGHEAMDACKKMQVEMLSAAKRFEKNGRMGLTAVGINAARDVIEYHDLQRKSISRAEYDRHIKATVNRIKSGAPEVTDVLETA